MLQYGFAPAQYRVSDHDPFSSAAKGFRMKVKRNTPDQLIVENNPILMAIMISLMGLIFFSVGLFTITSEIVVGLVFLTVGLAVGIGGNMIFVRRTQVIFDRPAGTIEMRRRSWFGYSKSHWDLAHLEKVIVQTTRIRKSNGTRGAPSHRAALVIAGGMDPGEHPLTIVYSTSNTAARITGAINGWLGVLDSTGQTS